MKELVLRSIKLDYLLISLNVVIVAIVLLVFSCKTPHIITRAVSKTDTTYKDTIIYNYIKRDSTIITTNNIMKDTTIYKDSVAYKIRIAYTGDKIYIAAIEDSVGLAYAKAWVEANILHLLVVQRDSTIETRLDSAKMVIHQQDSIIQTLQSKPEKVANPNLQLVKDIVLLVLIIIGVFIAYKLIRLMIGK